MSKKTLIAVAVLVLLAFTVPTAYAAITGQDKAEVKNLYKQMFSIRKQIVDKYVQSGEITKEQGQDWKERIDAMEKYRESTGWEPGAGRGCGGGGCGGAGCGGFGAGSGLRNQNNIN